jgi:uncharacterized protein YcnI
VGLACLTAVAPAAAQVSINPATTTPGAWERFAIRVANPSDTPIVAIRVAVPTVITILGVEPADGWAVQLASETRPQAISWMATVPQGVFQEFAFLGRVAGDARQATLVLPVTLIRPDGSELAWTASMGSPRPAPRVRIVGTTQLSGSGMVALAGAALVVAILALIVAVTRRQRHDGMTA